MLWALFRLGVRKAAFGRRSVAEAQGPFKGSDTLGPWGLGLGVLGFGFRCLGVLGLGFRGLGFKVEGFRVLGFGV